MSRLSRSFFARDPHRVARDLVGARCHLAQTGGTLTATLLEVEAYGGEDDPASHARRGPTPRSRVMFAGPGHLYVYLSYGVHWCVNIVTGPVGVAGAVLLRSAYVQDGASEGSLVTGPGRLGRVLGLTGVDNGIDCCQRASPRLWLSDATESYRVTSTPRVGVSLGADLPWRYVARDFLR